MAEGFTDIFEELYERGVFDYGESIKLEHLLESFGVRLRTDDDLEGLTVDQMRKAIKADDLAALNVIDNIRSKLLKRGRYLQQQRGTLRVALPSENKNFINKYLDEGMRKYKRAQLLLDNSPVDPDGEKDNNKSRAAIMELANERAKKKTEIIK